MRGPNRHKEGQGKSKMLRPNLRDEEGVFEVTRGSTQHTSVEAWIQGQPQWSYLELNSPVTIGNSL